MLITFPVDFTLSNNDALIKKLKLCNNTSNLKKEIYLKSRELYQARVEMTSLGNNPEKRQQLETRIIQTRKELHQRTNN